MGLDRAGTEEVSVKTARSMPAKAAKRHEALFSRGDGTL